LINAMHYTDDEIINRIKQLDDYKKAGKLPEGFFLVGIRSGDDAPDKFDDRFYLFKGEASTLDTSGTTNPGVSVLTGGFKKYNNQGAAVLESDRIYFKVWTPGKHLGKADALLQRGAKVTCYRDGDMDRLSEEIGYKSTGWYGINFHIDQHNLREDKHGDKIGGWSAGCQVCNTLVDYKKIIELTKNQQYISYILLKEWSI